MTKVIIAGGRDFADMDLLSQTILGLYSYSELSSLEIVSGRARGADRLGEVFAYEHDIPVKFFPAEWDKHGKAAGFIRNKEMAGYADVLVAFWDGKSKGTSHMINLAKAQDLSVHVVYYGDVNGTR